MKEPPTIVTNPQPQGPEPGQTAGDRWLLWVDGVGGFLVCLQNRVTLGHAGGGGQGEVDVPLLADVSRLHAILQRDPEGYFLEAVRSVRVNDRQADKALLHSGDRITLGRSCQFIFTQAVPISASARLDLVSGHRFWRALEGVLLMADTLVLGVGPQAHIRVPDLDQSLILFRQKTGLAVRYPGRLVINDQLCRERGPLESGFRVVTEEVSLTVEKV